MSADDHGSASTYANWKCRCEPCRAAWAQAIKRRRASRRQELAAGVWVQHGSNSTYTNWGCRCEPCTNAHRRVAVGAP